MALDAKFNKLLLGNYYLMTILQPHMAGLESQLLITPIEFKESFSWRHEAFKARKANHSGGTCKNDDNTFP